jgi:hypothetical protein
VRSDIEPRWGRAGAIHIPHEPHRGDPPLKAHVAEVA